MALFLLLSAVAPGRVSAAGLPPVADCHSLAQAQLGPK
jgi:hypothetical protein